MPISFPNLLATSSSSEYHPGYQPGVYYFAFNNIIGSSTGTTGFTTGIARYQPFFVAENIYVDRLCLDIAGAITGAKAKLALYGNSGSIKGRPGALLAETSEIDCATTGAKEATISATYLQKGWVWIASICNAAPPNARVLNNQILNNWLGDSSNAGLASTGLWACLAGSATYPTFPGDASTVNTQNKIVPVVKFRVKP